MILFTRRVCLSACWDTAPPWTRQVPSHPPPLGPGRHLPPHPTPPPAEHTGRYGQRAGGMYPTGMQSCFLLSFLYSKSIRPRPDKVNPQLFLHDIICSNSLLGTISKDYIRVHPDAPYYQIQSTDTELPLHYAQIKVLGCYH